MTSTAEKLRGLTLALLMVGSVFAGSVAFAGSAAAAAGNVSNLGDNGPVDAEGTVTVTGDVTTGADVTFQVADSNGDTDTVTFTEGSDADNDGAADGSFSFDIDLTQLDLGSQVDVGGMTIKAQEGSSFSSSTLSTSFTVNPAVSASPSTVTVGEISTVSVDVAGTSGTFDYEVYKKGSPSSPSTTGSSSGDSFSFTFEPGVIDTYVVKVTAADGETQTAEISSTYAVENFSLSPSSPVNGETVTVEGNLVNGDGGVNNKDVTLDTADDKSKASTTTVSDGSFSMTSTLNDAGEYELMAGGTVVENFTVDSADANVTINPAGNNTGGFPETYTVAVTDGNGNAIDFSNYDGYVNITGEFSNVGTITAANDNNQDLVDTGDDSNVDAIRVDPAATSKDPELDANEFQIDATPVAGSGDVTATLENNDASIDKTDGTATFYDGIEAPLDPVVGGVAADTPDSPDYVGSDSAAITTASSLNVQASTGNNKGDGSVAALTGEDITVEVLGQDGNGPDDTSKSGNNFLKNATVSLTGPGVDQSTGAWYDDGSSQNIGDADAASSDSNSVTFTGVTAAEAGTITVDITAYDDNGNEYTATKQISVTGDKIASVSPASAAIEDNGEISVEVTNAEDTPVNNREVIISASGSAELTVWDQDDSQTRTTQTLVIDGNNGVVATTEAANDIQSDNKVLGEIAVNNGVYTAQNVTFTNPGDLDVTVDRDASKTATETAQSTNAISVTGVSVYNISADKMPLVAGVQETVNFTVTNQTGATVTGSDLSNLAGSFEIKQETSSVATNVGAVNTTGDSAVDVIQADITPTAVDSQVNVTIDAPKTGSTSVAVEAPQVMTNLSSNTLTQRLASTVDVTVLNPRTGDRLENAEFEVNVANGTAQLSGTSADGEGLGDNEADTGADASKTLATTDNDIADSNASFDVVGFENETENFELSIAAKSDGSTYFTGATIDIDPMQVSTSPSTITLGETTTLNVNVEDATGDAVASQRVDISGAGVNIEGAQTDAGGVVNVQANPQATGQIGIFVDSDSDVYSSSTALPQVGTGSDPASTQEASVLVQTAQQAAYGINAGSLSPSTVSDNQTVTHTLSFSVDEMSNDGNSDTITVTLPSSVSIAGANSVTVTDADGEQIQVSSSPSLADANGGTNNQVSFGIQPDSTYNTSTVNVEASIDVAFPDVSADVTAPINATVADSSAGSTGPTTVASVTVENTTADDGDGDAGFEPGTPPAEYDSDNDGELSVGELGSAASDYATGDLSLQGLAQVASAYSS